MCHLFFNKRLLFALCRSWVPDPGSGDIRAEDLLWGQHLFVNCQFLFSLGLVTLIPRSSTSDEIANREDNLQGWTLSNLSVMLGRNWKRLLTRGSISVTTVNCLEKRWSTLAALRRWFWERHWKELDLSWLIPADAYLKLLKSLSSVNASIS